MLLELNWNDNWNRHLLSFNMQGESQPKSNSPKCLGEAKFDCKYFEHVYLFYLALFTLRQKISKIDFLLHILYVVHDPQQSPLIGGQATSKH
jgi:hypothetical protein